MESDPLNMARKGAQKQSVRLRRRRSECIRELVRGGRAGKKIEGQVDYSGFGVAHYRHILHRCVVRQRGFVFPYEFLSRIGIELLVDVPG